MKKVYVRTTLVLLAMALLWPVAASAQGVFLAEGPIQNVLPTQNQMVVMGVRVTVPPGTPITTPTTTLANLRALLGAPLPGRAPLPGFLGGTAIINGTIIAGVPTADTVFVEPAENVMLGAITESTCLNATCSGPGNVLRVNGALMVPIRDPRLAAGPVTNLFGFEVDLTGVNLVGAAAETEGYFANNRFNYFLLGVGRGALVNPGTEVNITRAQCRDEGPNIGLNILGNVHNPATGPVVITDTDTGTRFPGVGTAIVAQGRFGTYTYRLDNDPAFPTCPTSVTATFGGVTATADVDIIP